MNRKNSYCMRHSERRHCKQKLFRSWSTRRAQLGLDILLSYQNRWLHDVGDVIDDILVNGRKVAADEA